MDGMLTGKWEYDIIKMSRVEGKIDSEWEGAKTVCFFLTVIISIYLLYYGFIQTVFAP